MFPLPLAEKTEVGLNCDYLSRLKFSCPAFCVHL
jgi:hypothetical protein